MGGRDINHPNQTQHQNTDQVRDTADHSRSDGSPFTTRQRSQTRDKRSSTFAFASTADDDRYPGSLARVATSSNTASSSKLRGGRASPGSNRNANNPIGGSGGSGAAVTRARTTSISFASTSSITNNIYDSLCDEPQVDAPFTSAPTTSSSAVNPFDPLHPSPTSSSYTRPRRRVSLSVSAHGHAPAHTISIPSYPQPSASSPQVTTSATAAAKQRERARAMSLPSRSSRRRRHERNRDTDDAPKTTTKTRRIVITLLILLSLFLVGTVIVLSSVRYYFGIPSWAYLTESEVSWSPQDVIKPLLDPSEIPSSSGRSSRRQDWSEVTDNVVSAAADSAVASSGILGSETLPESWKELEEEIEELEEEVGETAYDDAMTLTAEGATTASSAQVDQDDDDSWGIDGRGTGGYWMKKDWDGRVDGTDSWERLYNVSTRPGETIPRLIHQTWKSDHLPDKWQKAWKECREGMPDYEYMLWTDETSRDFIAKHYPAHLHMFDTYKYPIQRADSIRYFILHHFGGVYMDLDIGCRRRLDPLLQGDWEVILPITKPVGVSNDLIFSSKGSAFMDDTVHGLSTFNHQYFTNYPTVMFSTGPMFLSAQYALYSSAHPLTETHPRAEVRILPKSLYGKNAPMSTVPHSFFSHFYGSSWHSDDAGFITFLGAWGKGLMWVGLMVLLLGVIRLIWVRRKAAAGQQYQLLSVLPTISSTHHAASRSGASTPTSSGGSDPMSPSSAFDFAALPHQLPQDIASVFKRAGNLILAAPATLLPGDRDRRNRRRTGLLYFVPALFQPAPVHRGGRGRTASEASQLPLRRSKRDRVPPPPPYEDVSEGGRRSGLGIDNISTTPRSRSPVKMGLEGDNTMDEVDAFLHEADTEGETSSHADGDADVESDRGWAAAWSGKDGGR
ncbi:hypothetical protein IAU60_000694 [Kwoniella sp. DSM 27419]